MCFTSVCGLKCLFTIFVWCVENIECYDPFLRQHIAFLVQIYKVEVLKVFSQYKRNGLNAQTNPSVFIKAY